MSHKKYKMKKVETRDKSQRHGFCFHQPFRTGFLLCSFLGLVNQSSTSNLPPPEETAEKARDEPLAQPAPGASLVGYSSSEEEEAPVKRARQD